MVCYLLKDAVVYTIEFVIVKIAIQEVINTIAILSHVEITSVTYVSLSCSSVFDTFDITIALPCLETFVVVLNGNNFIRLSVVHETGEFLTATRIIELIGLYVRTRLSPKRVAMSMNRLGFEARRTKYSRGWIAVTLTGDEIKSAQRFNAHYSSKDE